MRRLSRQTGRPLRLCTLAGVVGSLVVMALAPGCGADTCVIINSGTTSEWTVTLAVVGAKRIAALHAEVIVEPCNGICDCHDDCGCGECDCSGAFSSERSELDCEPLVDATYRGTLDEDGTAHIEVVAEEAITAPVEILKCDYNSTTEPSPSDFRIVVNGASGPSAKRLAPVPTIMVANISRR